MERNVDENRRQKREGSSAQQPSGQLDESCQGCNFGQIVRASMNCIGDELNRRTPESEIEQYEIFRDGPRKSDEAEPRGSQMTRGHRHDEEGQSQWYCKPEKIEQRVVSNTRLNRTGRRWLGSQLLCTKLKVWDSGRASHCCSDCAPASLVERIGSCTGHLIPTSGSSQRIPDSPEAL